MKVSSTVFLLILLVVVTVAVVGVNLGWFERARPAPTTADRPLLDVAAKEALPAATGETPGPIVSRRDDITGFVIARRSGTAVEFVKASDKWRMESPIRGPAKHWTVEQALDAVTDLKVTRQYAHDADDRPTSQRTGLDDPLFTVTLVYPQDVRLTVKVGKQRPLTPQTYVQMAGSDTIYLVDAELVTTLGEPAETYREPSLFEFQADRVRKLASEAFGKPQYELVRSNDTWRASTPIPSAVDADKVKDMVDTLRGLTAAAFVTGDTSDLAAFGLDNPALTLTLTVEDALAKTPAPATTSAPVASAPASAPATHQLRVAFGVSATGKAFARLGEESWLFRVTDEDVKALSVGFNQLRDRKVLRVQAKDVVAISTRRDGQEQLTLAKLADEWSLMKPFSAAVDESAVTKLIEDIAALTVSSFVDNYATLVGFGLEPAQSQYELKLADRTTRTLLVGRRSPSGLMVFVKVADAPSVMTVRAEAMKGLAVAPEKYWSRTFIKIERDKVAGLKLEAPELLYRIEQPTLNDFKFIEPPGLTVDRADIDALLNELGALKAEEIVFVGQAVPDQYAGAKPIRLTVTTGRPRSKAATQPTSAPAEAPAQPVEERTSVLRLVTVRRETYAWVENAEPIVVGKISDKTRNILMAGMRDRRVWDIRADQVTAFTLVNGDESARLARVDGTWRHITDDFLEIDQAKVADFLKGLQEARADRFLVHTAGQSDEDLVRLGLNKPAMALTVTTAKGEANLVVSAKGPPERDSRFAISSGVSGIFILPADIVEKLDQKLDGFVVDDKDDK